MFLCFAHSANALIKCIFHVSTRDCQGHRLSFFSHYAINNINQMGIFFSLTFQVPEVMVDVGKPLSGTLFLF